MVFLAEVKSITIIIMIIIMIIITIIVIISHIIIYSALVIVDRSLDRETSKYD